MRGLRVVALPALALGLGCATAPAGAAPGPVTAHSVRRLLEQLPAERFPGRPGHRATQQWLRDTLAGWGYRPRAIPFRGVGRADLELLNLELVLPGTVSDGPIVMACAHYDAVEGSPGADDNGSGTVALLEIARRLASRSLAAEVRLVWFDAEELNLVGSREYVARLPEDERERLRGVVNLESIGYADRRPGTQRMPPGSRLLLDPGDVADFVLIVGNLASQDLAHAVAAGLAAEQGAAMRVEAFSKLPGRGWLMPDSRRSDHAPFWDADVPAVMVTDTATFRNPNYHRPTDRVATLDLEFLAAVTRGVERALLVLAAAGD